MSNDAMQKVQADLAVISAATEDDLVRDLAALSPSGLERYDRELKQLAHDLRQSMAGMTLRPDLAWILAGNLEQALNPGRASIKQTQIAVSDFAHMLKVGGMDHGQADAIRASLARLVPQMSSPGVPDVPAHRFRYPLSEAPRYDRYVMVEDFEPGGNIWDTWYYPYWSEGIVAEFDPLNNCTGKYGLTISNTGPADKRSGMAKIPKPYQNIEGMNALRMWFKPNGQAPELGTFSTGLIDGSDEIWQVDVPEVFTGTEPYILQIRLADITRILRRNNRQLDLENRDFCFWFTGEYRFTVDDIMFVHDPDLPEFMPTPIQ
jgi:hypothetical protein